MANDTPSKHFPPLTMSEQREAASEVTWRTRMFQESRKQTLLLEQLVSLMASNGQTLEQVRAHFEHWEVQD